MDILILVQEIIAVMLLFCILIQHRSSGLSATFGGSGATSFVQRRGAEKVIYKLTIWLAIVFFALAVLQWYI